jgi:large subunit ribosomal protein L2
MGKRTLAQRRGRGTVIFQNKSGRKKVKYPPLNVGEKGVVVDLLHDPGHTAPVAVISVNNQKFHVLAAESIGIGDEVSFSSSTQIGSIVAIENVPEGIPIFNLELSSGDGGKIVRSAGTSATVISHDEHGVTVLLPSGKMKSIEPKCRVTIGVSAGGGRKEQPFATAGKHYYAVKSKGKIYPKVSGVAMNPVDHPHGGGSHPFEGGPTSVGRNTPPGAKIGKIRPKRTGKEKR